MIPAHSQLYCVLLALVLNFSISVVSGAAWKVYHYQSLSDIQLLYSQAPLPYVNTLTPSPTEEVLIHFPIFYNTYTTNIDVYWTVDGTNPTQSSPTLQGTYEPDLYNDGGYQVTIGTAVIPPQPAGITVKYIISAYHSSGGDVVYANSGICCQTSTCCDPSPFPTTTCDPCTEFTTPVQATVFSYTVQLSPVTMRVSACANTTVTTKPVYFNVSLSSNAPQGTLTVILSASSNFSFAFTAVEPWIVFNITFPVSGQFDILVLYNPIDNGFSSANASVLQHIVECTPVTGCADAVLSCHTLHDTQCNTCLRGYWKETGIVGYSETCSETAVLGQADVCHECAALNLCAAVICSSVNDSICVQCPAGLYLNSNHTCQECPEIPNCRSPVTACEFVNNSRCDEHVGCVDGYFLDSNARPTGADVCRACTTVADCAVSLTCNSTTTSQCTTCQPGFWRQTGPSGDVCTECNRPTGCWNVTCSSVSDSICQTCVDGYYYNPVTFACIPCTPIANCVSLMCENQLSSRCVSCSPTYYVQPIYPYECADCNPISNCNTTVLPVMCTTATNSHCPGGCDEGSVMTSFSNLDSCNTCAPVGFCKTHSSCGPTATTNVRCAECIDGFYRVSGANSDTCYSCPLHDGCTNATCLSPGNVICSECESGYYLSGTYCVDCTVNLIHCDFALCSNYSDKVCQTCSQGYYLTATHDCQQIPSSSLFIPSSSFITPSSSWMAPSSSAAGGGDSETSSSSVPIGAAVGGAVGGVVFLALLAYVLFRMRTRKKSEFSKMLEVDSLGNNSPKVAPPSPLVPTVTVASANDGFGATASSSLPIDILLPVRGASPSIAGASPQSTLGAPKIE